jgi:hypothetical protein
MKERIKEVAKMIKWNNRRRNKTERNIENKKIR